VGGASRNRVRANRSSGNGYASQGSNFGIGLLNIGGAANDNVVTDNVVVGNTNGIIVDVGTQGNFIRRNIVAGNPAVQVSVNNPTTSGVDIRNNATPGANTFHDNFCLTAVNVACPAVDDTPLGK
jgi:parallel beta-helix repeat protein